MKYLQEIRTYSTDPLGLEKLYERAQEAGESSEFAEDLKVSYQEDS